MLSVPAPSIAATNSAPVGGVGAESAEERAARRLSTPGPLVLPLPTQHAVLSSSADVTSTSATGSAAASTTTTTTTKAPHGPNTSAPVSNARSPKRPSPLSVAAGGASAAT